MIFFDIGGIDFEIFLSNFLAFCLCIYNNTLLILYIYFEPFTNVY